VNSAPWQQRHETLQKLLVYSFIDKRISFA
jgi:hypothetical protein